MTRISLVFFLSLLLLNGPQAQRLDSLLLVYKSTDESREKAESALLIAQYYQKASLDSAIKYFDIARSYFQQVQDTSQALLTLQYQRSVLVENNEIGKALENALQLSEEAQLISNTDLGHLHLEIADLYWKMDNEKQMLSYARSANDLFKSQDDTLCSIKAYNLLVKGYSDIGAADSAYFFIREALDLSSGDFLLTDIYRHLSAIKLFQGDTTLAIEALKASIKGKVVSSYYTGLSSLYLSYAEILSARRETASAFSLMDSARFYALQATEPTVLAETYRLESALWDQKNDYQQAYKAYRRYTEIEDSLAAAEFFDFEDREERLLFQERRQIENSRLALLLERSASEVEEQRIWIILLVATLFVSLVISIRYLRTLKKSRWAYRQLQESNHKLLAKSRELEKAQEEIVKSEKMAFLGRIFAGIGHELNTPIAAVKSNLQLIEDSQLNEIRKYQELADDMSPIMLRMMIDLVIATYQSQQKPISTHKQRQLKKEVRAFFEERKPELSNELTDTFDDLKIYENLERFDPLYDHPNGVGFLELASFISTRTRSIMIATEALRRADRILFSLKTYSFKNLENEKIRFDLVRNINTILTLHNAKLKDITVYKQFDEEVEIEGFPDELTQVWTNLISNAAYANDFKGNLWIRIRQYAEEVRVEFEDTGGGIDAAVKEKIFEPFETTKPEGQGSGLGLSISKKVIEKHDGTITVENTPQGALFRVSLPRKSN